MQIVQAIVRGGGLLRLLFENETEFIPLLRVKSLNIKISKVIVANAELLSGLTVLPGGKQ